MIERVILDRGAMFAALRKDSNPLFGKRLAQSHVEGIEAILDSADRHGITDVDHVAQMLAQTYHETGTYMLGIKETVMPSHKDKRPSDATVIARLDKAWKNKQLPWVTTPYWRDGGFGRGPIQLTHWRNYLKMGTALGIDLRSNPDLALDTKIGADIVVVGMSQGLFTGKKLSDYKFPACLYLGHKEHPRRIVNGKDGTDDDITKYHVGFRTALLAGGFYLVTEIDAVSINADSIKANSILPNILNVEDLNKLTADLGSVVAGKLEAGKVKIEDAIIDAAVPASKWDWLIKLALKFLRR